MWEGNQTENELCLLQSWRIQCLWGVGLSLALSLPKKYHFECEKISLCNCYEKKAFPQKKEVHTAYMVRMSGSGNLRPFYPSHLETCLPSNSYSSSRSNKVRNGRKPPRKIPNCQYREFTVQNLRRQQRKIIGRERYPIATLQCNSQAGNFDPRILKDLIQI